MKEVSFFRNHENNDSFHYLEHFLDSNIQCGNINTELIRYLEKGFHFCDWMCIIQDEDGTVIGPNVYLTDGEWVWPEYFIYYLKKYVHSMIVDPSFIKYLNNSNFVYPQINEVRLREEYIQYVNPVKVSVRKKEKQIFRIKK